MLIYAPLHSIFEFFWVFDNFYEQLPKKEIYKVKMMTYFDLSIPLTISIESFKDCKIFIVKPKYQCNGVFK